MVKKQRKLNPEKWNPGKIPQLCEFLVQLHNQEPVYFNNPKALYERMKQNWKGLQDPKKCANCDASMRAYIYEFDYHDAILLLRMGEKVKSNLASGLVFTEANKMRVHEMAISYTQKSRTNQLSKLGIISQVVKEDGKRVPGVWLITKRGFDALAGLAVPKKVRVWRNQIQERYLDETITMIEALNSKPEGWSYDPQAWVLKDNLFAGKII